MADVNAVDSMLDEAAADQEAMGVSPSQLRPDPNKPTPVALIALIATQVGVHSAMAGTRMAMPLEALRAGHSTLVVGTLLACFAIAPVIFALPAGRLADRHGYHRPLHIGLGMTVVGALLALAATWLHGAWGLALQVVAGLLCGTGANTVVLATQRTVGRAATTSVERVRYFSWLGMAPALANAVGPVVAGLTIDQAGFGTAYGVMAALALASLMLSRRVPRESVERKPRDRNQTAWSLLTEPGFKRVIAVNWLVSASWDVHSFAVPVIGHERGFNATTIGLILGTFTLMVTVIRFLIPVVAQRLDEVTVLRVGMVGTALVFAIYPLMPGPWTMAWCAAALGVLLGSVQPMILSTLLRLTPEPRHGEALALRSMAINASSAAMPLAFGVVGVVTGVSVLFWAMGAAVGAGNVLARRLRA